MMKLRPVPLLDGAACRRHPDPDLWFSEKPAEREAARYICRSCPVLAECREWAIEAESSSGTTGIVGGMTSTERERAQAPQAAGQRAGGWRGQDQPASAA
jgi:WhiB family transcriptional regulator, redox-sensing transcriptional regulator